MQNIASSNPITDTNIYTKTKLFDLTGFLGAMLVSGLTRFGPAPFISGGTYPVNSCATKKQKIVSFSVIK
jgi:hypothetical protein